MGYLKAEIRIMLKEKVQDPQGLAIKDALSTLNFPLSIEEVRVGKIIVMKIEKKQKKQDIKRTLKDMCDKLLANPVIEDYEVFICSKCLVSRKKKDRV